MKRIILYLFLLSHSALLTRAETGIINLRLSVKIIQGPQGQDPTNGLVLPATLVTRINDEIERGNETLRRTLRGYRLQLLPLERIAPPVPAGESASYWFGLLAREVGNREAVEAAAEAAKASWAWNDNAINLYFNNTSSGRCSFPGSGDSILMGSAFHDGTVLHEIGHFFDLRHTHAGDNADQPDGPWYAYEDLTDGDGLDETARDNPNIINRTQLSLAFYQSLYQELNAEQQSHVNSAFKNVMSYHDEEELLEKQMDIWSDTGNLGIAPGVFGRSNVVSGTTRFIDASVPGTGFGTSTSPHKFLGLGVTAASAAGNDILLLRPGTYTATTLSKPLTLRATRNGPVVIQKP